MTKEDNRSFARKWNEFWGRKSIMEPIPFTETSILTQPVSINVGYFGYYLRLPPNTAAIIRSATDQTYVFSDGGHKDLQEGAYTIQYIDTSERFFSFPRVSAPALDSSEVSLTISIFYKLNDPTLIKSNLTPLKVLFSVCEGSIKNFIVTHRYDQLIGERENEHFIADYQIVQHIKEQVALSDACKAFWIKDVIIEERLGSSEMTKHKQDRLVQENQILIQKEGVLQQQEIAEQRKELEKTKAEQDIMVKEMQALFETNKNEILKQVRVFEVELEALRKQPDLQQAQFLKIIDTKKQTVNTLLQLFTISGFPRNQNDLQLIDKILSSLSETQRIAPQLPPERSKSMNELNSTIINLIAPKLKFAEARVTSGDTEIGHEQFEQEDRLEYSKQDSVELKNSDDGEPPHDKKRKDEDYTDKNYKLSIAYPKLLAKRFETNFLLQIYLPIDRAQVTRNIRAEFQEQFIEKTRSSMIKIGQKVRVKFFSPEFDFSEPVTKLIDDTENKIAFLGKPKDGCQPGLHKILISISDSETDLEFESLTIIVQVVDFAFDHVSRPLLSRASSVFLGIGSFAMFILTFLEQIDKSIGFMSGTAAGVLAAVVYTNFYNLYQRVRPNTP